MPDIFFNNLCHSDSLHDYFKILSCLIFTVSISAYPAAVEGNWANVKRTLALMLTVCRCVCGEGGVALVPQVG